MSSDPRARKLASHEFNLHGPDAAALASSINDATRTGGGAGRSLEGGAPRRFFCIVNPVSGSGRAQRIFEDSVRPVLDAAGAQFDVHVTQMAGEATGLVRCLDRGRFDAVVACGGDGTFHEVVEGLVSRADAREACGELALVHIPGGSGNAIPTSVAAESNEALDPVSAAYIAVKGSPCPFDAACAWDTQGVARPLVLSTTWGLVSDVDFKSEWMRCCGGLRFQVQALWSIMFLNEYHGQVQFLPACNAGLGDATATFGAEFYDMFSPPPLASGAPLEGQRRSLLLPPLGAAIDERPPDGWECLEGNFNFCVACNAAFIDTSTPLAPDARLNDGALTLVTSINNTRCTILGSFLTMSDGSHLQRDSVRATRVRALRLVTAEAAPSAMGIDGELVTPAGAGRRVMEVVCYPGVLRLMML